MSTDYTPNAERALEGAVAAARQFNHSYVGTEHILCSILAIPTCEAYRRFERLHIEPEELRLQLESMIGRGEAVRIIGDIPLTARTKKILELAKIEANHLNCEQVGTEHMVLAMLREGESVGAQILYGHNLDPEKFMAASSSSPNVPPPPEDGEGQENEPDDNSEDGVPEESKGKKGKSKTPALNTFGRDLTALARKGELDPVIGRKTELQRIVQVLCRRTKNNAVLIGEAGVGKTAVVEGLAQAIAVGDVPERLRDRRVISLDMARVVAGTQYRGQFEERLKQLIEETKRVKNVILFLAEIHTMVGAGGSEGAMDAANILKPALARGELQVVGATTLKEYHKSIE